jgi:DNA repair exonuclease SbcCD nuclease subunit
MRILHTGDFHLREYGDDRWKALESLIQLGKDEEIHVLAISGDLFDRDIDAENLRPRIREAFSNTGFKIVLIPGNHDRDSYGRATWFGEDVVALSDYATPLEYGEVSIWGMPFEPIEVGEVLHRIQSLGTVATAEKSNVLLFHGELLDAFFSRGDFGDEGQERYMPAKLSFFKDSNIDYVLAGHFHSTMNSWKLKNGGYFVYPGSPISITKRETGQRKVNLFELGGPPEEHPLDTPHFEEVVIDFDAFQDTQPMETVRERFSSLHRSARVVLIVKGFLDGRSINMSEQEIAAGIQEVVADRCAAQRYEFRDIQTIVEDDLMKRYLEKLDTRGYVNAQRKAVRDIAMKAMMDARR